MNWDTVFALTNAIAVAAWVILLFLPRGPRLMALVLYLGVGLLCLVYVAMVAGMLSGAVDAKRLAGAAEFSFFDYNVAGLRNLFLSDGGLVMGWTHYLALDLFTGLWIAKDADHKGFSRLAQGPVLLATFAAGPLGLLLWLVIRERRARGAGRKDDVEAR